MVVHALDGHNLLPSSLLLFASPRLFPSLGLFLLGRLSDAHEAIATQRAGTAYVQGISVILRNVRVESLVIIRFFNRATMQIHAYACTAGGRAHGATCIIDGSRY